MLLGGCRLPLPRTRAAQNAIPFVHTHTNQDTQPLSMSVWCVVCPPRHNKKSLQN
jgi:hypothetical protein